MPFIGMMRTSSTNLRMHPKFSLPPPSSFAHIPPFHLQAMKNTRIMCAVMLDTKGPEIRTGFLKDAKPVQLTAGQEVTITTDYEYKGDSEVRERREHLHSYDMMIKLLICG